MSDQAKLGSRRYEIRLLASNGEVRLFATAVATDLEAVDYAKGLLIRHLDCEGAEVWSGMKLLRQL